MKVWVIFAEKCATYYTDTWLVAVYASKPMAEAHAQFAQDEHKRCRLIDEQRYKAWHREHAPPGYIGLGSGAPAFPDANAMPRLYDKTARGCHADDIDYTVVEVEVWDALPVVRR